MRVAQILSFFFFPSTGQCVGLMRFVLYVGHSPSFWPRSPHHGTVNVCGSSVTLLRPCSRASCFWEAGTRQWLWAAQGSGCLPGGVGPQCLLQVPCCCLLWSKRETHFSTFHYFLFWKTTLERLFLWQIEYLHYWFPPLFFFLWFSSYSAFVKDFSYSLRTLSAENYEYKEVMYLTNADIHFWILR